MGRTPKRPPPAFRQRGDLWNSIKGVCLPESRHRGRKYLHCPDLRPGDPNKRGCPRKANRIFYQIAVPHQTFICPFFIGEGLFLVHGHLSGRFLHTSISNTHTHTPSCIKTYGVVNATLFPLVRPPKTPRLRRSGWICQTEEEYVCMGPTAGTERRAALNIGEGNEGVRVYM